MLYLWNVNNLALVELTLYSNHIPKHGLYHGSHADIYQDLQLHSWSHWWRVVCIHSIFSGDDFFSLYPEMVMERVKPFNHWFFNKRGSWKAWSSSTNDPLYKDGHGWLEATKPMWFSRRGRVWITLTIYLIVRKGHGGREALQPKIL